MFCACLLTRPALRLLAHPPRPAPAFCFLAGKLPQMASCDMLTGASLMTMRICMCFEAPSQLRGFVHLYSM